MKYESDTKRLLPGYSQATHKLSIVFDQVLREH